MAFQITVENLGPSAVAFGGGTVLRLLDPDGSSLAATLAGPIAIEPGAVGDLLFQPVTIDTALAPGRYTPLLRLAGTDSRGAAVDTLIAAPFESFAIEVLAIEAVVGGWQRAQQLDHLGDLALIGPLAEEAQRVLVELPQSGAVEGLDDESLPGEPLLDSRHASHRIKIEMIFRDSLNLATGLTF